MSKSAFTVKVFGIYVLVLGVTLIAVPNLLLAAFRMPQTSEVWIRVVGVLAFNIGIYYWYAAKSEARALFRASVYARTFVLAAFAGFAFLGLVSPLLILFGSVDFFGAVWTHLALRSEMKPV
jgi:hypothetical protein